MMLYLIGRAAISEKQERLRQGGFGRVVARWDLASHGGRGLRQLASAAAWGWLRRRPRLYPLHDGAGTDGLRRAGSRPGFLPLRSSRNSSRRRFGGNTPG